MKLQSIRFLHIPLRPWCLLYKKCTRYTMKNTILRSWGQRTKHFPWSSNKFILFKCSTMRFPSVSTDFHSSFLKVQFGKSCTFCDLCNLFKNEIFPGIREYSFLLNSLRTIVVSRTRIPVSPLISLKERMVSLLVFRKVTLSLLKWY